MIRRPPRSTQSRSSAASDVYKRQSWIIGAPHTTTTSVRDAVGLQPAAPPATLPGRAIVRPRMAVVAVLTDVAPTSGRGVVEHVRRGPQTTWFTRFDDILLPDTLIHIYIYISVLHSFNVPAYILCCTYISCVICREFCRDDCRRRPFVTARSFSIVCLSPAY